MEWEIKTRQQDRKRACSSYHALFSCLEGEFIYETISTATLTHEEWLRLRKTGIGGSDAGAICGLNPYSSAIQSNIS